MNKRNDYGYLCMQLQTALDDAPGGEKAWVPLRRNLVQSCIESLQAAAAGIDLLHELRAALDSLLGDAENEEKATAGGGPITLDTNLLTLVQESQPDNDDSSLVGLAPQRWADLSRDDKIFFIRNAEKTGARYDWMPDRRTWKRHYPEAYYPTGVAPHA